MEPDHPNVAVIVAHPDDETLWAGGALLLHPEWQTTIITLCRGSDPDRAPKFLRVLERFGAAGAMGELDDGPEQDPLPPEDVERVLLTLLPRRHYFRVLTHGPRGEYTRHLRHEETCRAVVSLWASGQLDMEELWAFSYEDAERQRLPHASDDADIRLILPQSVWKAKWEIITSLYGFTPNSWEARTTPRVEGFRAFYSARKAHDWVVAEGVGA